MVVAAPAKPIPLPRRLRRLGEALAALPLDEPMLLTELDGYLTGVSVCPVPITSNEWLPNVWGVEENGGHPIGDPAYTRWFAEAVIAQHDEIARSLQRGRLQPIFDVDERNGEVLWEAWLSGFVEAMALRPHAWAALADGDDLDMVAVMSRLWILISVVRDDSDLDSREINDLYDRAPADLVGYVLRLHASRGRHDALH